MSKLFLCFICFVCVCAQSNAQEYNYTELGFGPGISVYQGDLSPHRFGSFRQAGLGLQLYRNFSFHPALSLRLNYAFAFLQESDKNYSFTYKPYRNFSFDTKVNELSVQLMVNPLRNNGEEDYGALVPYLFGGPGFALTSIQRDWSDFNHSYGAWQSWVRPGLAADSLQNTPKFIFTLPVGAGIRYFFAENFSFYAEVSHRLTREEYLDGFSKAANQKNKDAFTTFIVGLVFRRSTNSYYKSTRRRVY